MKTFSDDDGCCLACGVLLTKRTRELHHFPIPGRLGGQATVPLCIPCHDMVDRKNFEDWPIGWVFDAWASMPREGRLYLLKVLSRLSSDAEKPFLNRVEAELTTQGLPE